MGRRGVRLGRTAEKVRDLLDRVLPERLRPDKTPILGSVLSLDPPIVYVTTSWPDTMQFIRPVGRYFGREHALLLLFNGWHIGDDIQDRLHEIRAYRRRYPKHELQFLCNAADEVETFRRSGEPSWLLNHNLTISEDLFRPLPDVKVDFSAVCNARLAPGKRIHLAAQIDSVAYIVRMISRDGAAEAAQILAELQALAPNHQIVNPRDDGQFSYMGAEAVNLVYARAAVGLCLSAVEGAMLSSMEYMLAGLPIVSTPSLGGRDFFFDPEYCAIVPPDPGAIRDAVAEMKSRKIPRAYIREKTLLRVEKERDAFLGLLDDYLKRRGYPPRFAGDWPWRQKRSLCGWSSVPDHVREMRRERTARPR